MQLFFITAFSERVEDQRHVAAQGYVTDKIKVKVNPFQCVLCAIALRSFNTKNKTLVIESQVKTVDSGDFDHVK